MERRVPQELEGGRVVSVLEGDQLVTDESDMLLSTVLGSCVAVCARDPVAGVGGMNHFLLPGEDGPHQGGEATKRLLERIVAQGGRLDRIEVKLFGGADPSWKGAHPGALNREFIL
ncbi:MAG: chemotaxis protein, partial [Rhodospirillales bacterium]|nr:chemotaxis protein [Rhodospirillales bacterium]